ncbi:hypothetical protein [Pulveribacter suum]|uniref:Uncharacterized protein n=1 Tax=Pulveribacter suum TaxID=2116657 RepID=A0A2P1NMN8_9BURK|nr:hypothetical protein [Pulveribacter suum]AVP58319.1 hypothetical protein C7H73_12020 [Pulveribacter suum]
MIFLKTETGQQALKERHGTSLSPRQRSAFILFDGKRTVEQVLSATAPMGITMDDVQSMLDQGLLHASASAGGGTPAGVNGAAQSAGGDEQAGTRSSTERYQEAYPIAIELTAGLGLRGFRLNLAVEGTTSYDELAQLAPRLREAVGEAKYARLGRALFD